MSIPPLPLRPTRAGMSRPMRTRLTFVLAGCILAIVATAVLLAVFPTGKQALLPLGAPAPGFTLRTSAGATVSLQRLRGKVVLLEFCASWSSHCVTEVPVLNRLRALSSTVVLYIDGDSEEAASVSAFARTFHARFPLALDPGQTTVSFPAHGPRGPVTGRYRVTAFPTFYVLDPHGRVAWRSAGEQPVALLARELHQAARPVP
jgi:peroxiredoxin